MVPFEFPVGKLLLNLENLLELLRNKERMELARHSLIAFQNWGVRSQAIYKEVGGSLIQRKQVKCLNKELFKDIKSISDLPACERKK